MKFESVASQILLKIQINTMYDKEKQQQSEKGTGVDRYCTCASILRYDQSAVAWGGDHRKPSCMEEAGRPNQEDALAGADDDDDDDDDADELDDVGDDAE